MSNIERKIIGPALDLAMAAHAGKHRLSGDPYFSHSLAVADRLLNWSAPPGVVAAGLLHDVLNQRWSNLTDLSRIRKVLGREVANLILATSSLGRLTDAKDRYVGSELADAVPGDDTIEAIAQRAPDACVIKIADRLHNLETSAALPSGDQLRAASTVMNVYVPMAEQLGMYVAKSQMQDLCFRILRPADNLALRPMANLRDPEAKDRLQRYLKSRVALEHIYWLPSPLEVILERVHIDGKGGDGQGVKHREGGSLVVVCADWSDCYLTLGHLHHGLGTTGGVVRDFIATPKGNGYRALHTDVPMPGQQSVRVIIRDRDMDAVANWGYTAKWRGVAATLLPDLTRLSVGHTDAIKVLTPKGSVRYLPKGSTPIDFAYLIHADYGNHLCAAFVNESPVSLFHELQTGDVVRLEKNDQHEPLFDWLDHVTTSRAKSRIRQWLAARQRTDMAAKGEEILNAALSHLGLTVADLQVTRYLTDFAYVNGHGSLVDLLVQLGTGQVNARKVLANLQSARVGTDLPESARVDRNVTPEDARTPTGKVTWLKVEAYNRPGLAAALSDLLFQRGYDMRRFLCFIRPDGMAHADVYLNSINHLELQDILASLSRVSDVTSVTTGNSVDAQPHGAFCPYDIMPARGELFVGREAELRTVRDLLSSPQSVMLSVWGHKRIGKTSFLAMLEEDGHQSGRYLPLIVDLSDCHGLSVINVVRRIMRRLEHEINRQTGITQRELGFPRERSFRESPWAAFDQAIEQCTRLSRPIVLMLDEFQVVGSFRDDAQGTVDALAHKLRAIATHSHGHIKLILSGSGELHELQKSPGVAALLSSVRDIPLKYLDRAAAKRLFSFLNTKSRRVLSGEAITWLAGVTGGHPYLINLLGIQLYDHSQEGQHLSLSNVKSLVDRWLYRPERAVLLQHLWLADESARSRGYREILSALAGARDHSSAKTADPDWTGARLDALQPRGDVENGVTTLSWLGVLQLSRTQYRIGVPLLGRWLRRFPTL